MSRFSAITNHTTHPTPRMGKIAKIEYFRVPPRWLFVKITDQDSNTGWGEASLEGHTQAVEGCLDAWREQYTGLEADLARKAQGFTAVKMNATSDVAWLDSPARLAHCVERVQAVKAQGLDVGVDFHGRLHRPMAKQLAALLAPLQPLFIEEPLLPEHIEAVRQLAGQAAVPVPVALGERLHSRWDAKPFLEASCVDVLQPDVCHVGGISELRRIAAMAEAYDVPVAPHCPLGPVALAASLQVAAATPNFAIQEMSLGIHYNLGGYDLLSYITNPHIWDVKDGYVELMDGPGLGISVNEQLVREASKGAEAWVSPGFVGPGGELREW
ncbi:galactonate dehydratase, partial [Metarhizium majus ARSEF 297]